MFDEDVGFRKHPWGLPYEVKLAKWLGIIYTCRQIHAETAILPFNLQTLVIDRLDRLHTVCAQLTQDQRDAAREIQVTTTLSSYAFRSLRVGTMEHSGEGPVRFEDLLPGVVKVKIINEEDEWIFKINMFADDLAERQKMSALEVWFKEGTGNKVTVEWEHRRQLW